jgi:hypothetical protein
MIAVFSAEIKDFVPVTIENTYKTPADDDTVMNWLRIIDSDVLKEVVSDLLAGHISCGTLAHGSLGGRRPSFCQRVREGPIGAESNLNILQPVSHFGVDFLPPFPLDCEVDSISLQSASCGEAF